jgi:predicted TPR repeat methyltransferase
MSDSTADEKFFSGSYGLRDNRDTKALYAAWANTYDAELTEEGYAQPVRAAAALAAIVPDRSARILDVRCGTGLSGKALIDAGCRTVHGCDFSSEMLMKAERLGVYKELFEADLNEPLARIADEVFDAVTAVGCFSFGHISVDAIDELAGGGAIDVTSAERGEHMPGRDVYGWVITALKK